MEDGRDIGQELKGNWKLGSLPPATESDSPVVDIDPHSHLKLALKTPLDKLYSGGASMPQTQDYTPVIRQYLIHPSRSRAGTQAYRSEAAMQGHHSDLCCLSESEYVNERSVPSNQAQPGTMQGSLLGTAFLTSPGRPPMKEHPESPKYTS